MYVMGCSVGECSYDVMFANYIIPHYIIAREANYCFYYYEMYMHKAKDLNNYIPINVKTNTIAPFNLASM